MKVAIVDYGTGNLHSLAKALEAGGAQVAIEPDVHRARYASAVVLPGVGAFAPAAAQLSAGAGSLRELVAAGKPVLGICLGMQLLFEASEEGQGHGAGVLPGRVRRLHARRLPHMGWNQVVMMDPDPLFDGLDDLVVYYANSFVVEPADSSDVIAWTQYGAEQFPAAVRRGSLWGVQFHPEKSGSQGLRLLRNFLAQVR